MSTRIYAVTQASRDRARATRAERAAMAVHEGDMRVPTEAPARMVMLLGMGER